MVLDTDAIVARALRESRVRKRRPAHAYGFYVREDDLLRSAAFWADGAEVTREQIRQVIEAAGGQRLGGVIRRRQYFLPASVYRRLRERTPST